MQILKNIFNSFSNSIAAMELEAKAVEAASLAQSKMDERLSTDADYKFYKWLLSLSQVELTQIKSAIVKYGVGPDEMLYALYSIYLTDTQVQEIAQRASNKQRSQQKFTVGGLSNMMARYVDAKAVTNMAFPENFAKEFMRGVDAHKRS